MAQVGGQQERQDRAAKRRDPPNHDVRQVEVANLRMQERIHQGVDVGDEKNERKEDRDLNDRVPRNAAQPWVTTYTQYRPFIGFYCISVASACWHANDQMEEVGRPALGAVATAQQERTLCRQ